MNLLTLLITAGVAESVTAAPALDAPDSELRVRDF